MIQRGVILVLLLTACVHHYPQQDQMEEEENVTMGRDEPSLYDRLQAEKEERSRRRHRRN